MTLVDVGLIYFSDAALAQAVQDICNDISDMAVYIKGPLLDQKVPKFLSFDIVLERMSSDPIDPAVRKHMTFSSTNVLIYTSGTTGRHFFGICSLHLNVSF